MRELSPDALTVLELSPVEMVRCAADAGYSHVGLRLVPATDNEPRRDMVGDTATVREVAAALADTGVQVLDLEILRLRPDTDVRDFAAMLENRRAPRRPSCAGRRQRSGRGSADCGLAALSELAVPLQLSIYLEPMPWTDARDFTQAWC